MNSREQIAAMAMQGILSNEVLLDRIREDMASAVPVLRDHSDPEQNFNHRQATFMAVAEMAVEQADYLLAALKGSS